MSWSHRFRVPAGRSQPPQIIGGGVIGLAIARQLARAHPGSSTVLLERHLAVGTETSSRNSEVIHGGLYYPRESLKTALCIKGARMLYDFCATHHIPHKRCGSFPGPVGEEEGGR
jgi:L-2-hydroxyglutarate oxidase LhgO